MAWHSLFLRTTEPPTDQAAVTTALLDSAQRGGYERYDPFTGGMGTPPRLKTFVKHFVAPAADGWIRVLGTPDRNIVIDLSRWQPVVYLWFDGDQVGVEAYNNGSTAPEALADFLIRGKTLDDLRKALTASVPLLKVVSNRSQDLLPDDVQALARQHNVNPDQANKLIDRLTANMFGRLDRQSGGEASDMQAQARALATSAPRLDWNSPAALGLQAAAQLLQLPSNWRDQDFDTVREAYQVARRLRKNPRSSLMPDEQAALKTLPNAIEYEAVYIGK